MASYHFPSAAVVTAMLAALTAPTALLVDATGCYVDFALWRSGTEGPIGPLPDIVDLCATGDGGLGIEAVTSDGCSFSKVALELYDASSGDLLLRNVEKNAPYQLGDDVDGSPIEVIPVEQLNHAGSYEVWAKLKPGPTTFMQSFNVTECTASQSPGVTPAPSTPAPTPADWGTCPVPTETTTCISNLENGSFTCTNGSPMTLSRINQYGPVYTLNMEDWIVVSIQATLDNQSGFAMNIGNSPSNNGHAGDSATTSNDSEMQILNAKVQIFANDFGGSGLVFNEDATSPSQDVGTAIICDSSFTWQSSTASHSYESPYIFQIDGDEPDPERGTLNDTNLHLAINQVVSNSYRNGSGVTGLTVTFGR